MRRTIAQTLLVLACAASLAACARHDAGTGGGAEPGVDAVIRQLKDLTEELTAKVESAPDVKAGVAEAQKLLDARKGEMAARIAAFKQSPGMQEPAARGKWLEAEVDNTQRVRELQLKRLDASMRDPELKAGLERLAADYDSMFKDR